MVRGRWNKAGHCVIVVVRRVVVIASLVEREAQALFSRMYVHSDTDSRFDEILKNKCGMSQMKEYCDDK
jgi:hypothetical protein